jgi:hypothetical protein
MATSNRSIVDRMVGAARFDVATYEEVEADTTATGQAAVVVALVAVASAIGALREGGTNVLIALVGALVGWAVWAGLTYVIGDKLLGGTATWGELLRTLGFAQAPGVLLALGILPLLGSVVRVVVAFWLLAAGIVAIRQALDVSTGKAVITAILGWLALLLVNILLGIGGMALPG